MKVDVSQRLRDLRKHGCTLLQASFCHACMYASRIYPGTSMLAHRGGWCAVQGNCAVGRPEARTRPLLLRSACLYACAQLGSLHHAHLMPVHAQLSANAHAFVQISSAAG